MKRFCVAMGLVMCLVSGGLAHGQEKPKSDAEKLKEFKPGSDTTYNWLTDFTEAEKAVKEQKSPLLIYFYCSTDKDKKIPYLFEVKIFASPEFSTVGGKFVTLKIDSSDDKALGPFKGTCKGRTAVKFFDPHLKPAASLTMPNPGAFKRIVDGLEKKFAAKEAKGEEEGGKKEKEGKEEKKEKSEKE